MNMEEEKETMETDQEKQHFFSDLQGPTNEQDIEEDAAMEALEANPSLNRLDGNLNEIHPSQSTVSGADTEQERHAQVGASPYLAPFTPLSSPNNPKTPLTSVNVGRLGGIARKPQLIPIQESGLKANVEGESTVEGSSISSNKMLASSDGVDHLPVDLVDSLMSTVQTLDKMILVVEDFKPDQLDFLCGKANEYIELLKQVDAAASKYDVEIPVEVLEMLDAETDTNPELYTKKQLEKCQEESHFAAGKMESLRSLKEILENAFETLG
uniref:Mediator of RNA polymerase II transcription subunit 10 n=1 Tax=Albugo laibachii Nc14 TaxID=890382 RepID=F0WHJ3_9STRA|nr:conserved hypothetical protein [Albugo laibachii Nc14]|eukprot:CCA20712.1 conserved hypothetical protein [Albugo laibachii Nc14]